MIITKAKKEFMQRFVAQIMVLPENADPIDYAESVWARLTERGYGDALKTNKTAKTAKPRVSIDWLDKVKIDFPNYHEYLVQLISAFKDNRGVNNGCKAFYDLCRTEPSIDQLKHVVYAAGVTAAGRKTNPADPIMLQGWINQRRFADIPLQREVKSREIEDAKDEEIRTLLGDQIRYKKELEKSPNDKALLEILENINERLKIARGVKNG